uniref:Uncharacterized protein n=1 Tax=Opuntia streptacantha TaxID=393608 RepID=A0A7C9EJJ5_OPUST
MPLQSFLLCFSESFTSFLMLEASSPVSLVALFGIDRARFLNESASLPFVVVALSKSIDSQLFVAGLCSISPFSIVSARLSLDSLEGICTFLDGSTLLWKTGSGKPGPPDFFEPETLSPSSPDATGEVTGLLDERETSSKELNSDIAGLAFCRICCQLASAKVCLISP